MAPFLIEVTGLLLLLAGFLLLAWDLYSANEERKIARNKALERKIGESSSSPEIRRREVCKGFYEVGHTANGKAEDIYGYVDNLIRFLFLTFFFTTIFRPHL